MWTTKILRLLVDTAALLVVASLAAGWLLRSAPGGSVDLRQADPRYSAESVARLKRSREAAREGLGRSLAWFGHAVRGDFGVSERSGLPVSEVVSERIPLTLGTVVAGAAGGFCLAIAAAAAGIWATGAAPRTVASAAFLGVLAIPSGLIALLAVFLRAPVEAAVAIAVAPRTYFYLSEMFSSRAQSDWMLAAHAAGLRPTRTFFRYLLPAVKGELAATGGLAIVNALAVTIPAEVLTGRPGIGQLAWQSATERDLPVVIAVTLVMLIVSRSVTLLSSLRSPQAGAAV